MGMVLVIESVCIPLHTYSNTSDVTISWETMDIKVIYLFIDPKNKEYHP